MSIELADLSVGYRTRRRTTVVAAGLHAVARRGELTVLLGPNGCGKSTLIRTLCGLQPALAGRVRLDGTDLTELAADQRARRVGVVLTDRVDPGLLSARELAGLGRIPHLGLSGRLRAEDDAVVDWALHAVGAAHLADRPAGQLSDGERQRVLTARALAQQPGLLVLDEPTAFLDVPSRAGLVELLRGLARDQDLTVVMSTHDLELALRVADRVWLMHPGGRLVDAVPEELMLGGQIGDLFDGDALRFDPISGTFTLRSAEDGRRSARLQAPEPLHTALDRVLAREGWHAVTGQPAEIVLTARTPEAITVHTGVGAPVSTGLGALPRLLRGLPAHTGRCAPESAAVAALAQVARIGTYFAVGTGPTDDAGWHPVGALYADAGLLNDVIDRVQQRIGAPTRRVAAATFHLGFAARVWSIWLGALIQHALTLELPADQLSYRQVDGGIRLHLPAPLCWPTEDPHPGLAAPVYDTHLGPLAAAVRAVEPISERLLRGNAASALLGSARVLDSHRGDTVPGPAWRLARSVCADERLHGAALFNDAGTDYRRTSCCLFYRTPGGGLCGDCVLDRKPAPAGRKRGEAERTAR